MEPNIQINIENTAQNAHPHVISFLQNIFTEVNGVHFLYENQLPELQPPFIKTSLENTTPIAWVDDSYDEKNQILKIRQQVKALYRVHLWGEGSQERADKLATLWKHPYATQFLSKLSPVLSPLYPDFRHLHPWVNESLQYEEEWQVDLYAQINQITSIPCKSADHIGNVITLLPNMVGKQNAN